jgi:hypothetical protein
MTNFLDRDEAQRWLMGIGPLARRREVAISLAARAALRVLPLLAAEFRVTPRPRVAILSELVLSLFHAVAFAWVAAKYPSRAVVSVGAVGRPADGADDLASYIRISSAAPNAGAPDARTAAHAAYSAYAAAVSRISTTGAVQAIVADGDSAVAAGVDAAWIDSGRSAAELAGSPLWPNGAHRSIDRVWKALKSELLSSSDGWKVWTDWYDSRLLGDEERPPVEALEIARATIADEIWKQGPAAVNAEIKSLIAEYEPETKRVEDAIDRGARNEAEFAPILATRATLRILPLMATDGARLGDAAKSKFLLSIFRALAAAWANTRYSPRDGSEWSDAAGNDVNIYRSGSAEVALYVADAAAQSALAAGNLSPARAAAHASRAFFQVRAATLAWRRDGVSDATIERANSSDEGDIVPGVRPEQIAQIELWPGRGPPSIIGEQWETLKKGLRQANEGWEVWIDWYEARLDGLIRSQEVELAYVQFIRNVLPPARGRRIPKSRG